MISGSAWNVLDWPKRMKIAIGAERCLAYLLEGWEEEVNKLEFSSLQTTMRNYIDMQFDKLKTSL
jgi:hypothetical protein